MWAMPLYLPDECIVCCLIHSYSLAGIMLGFMDTLNHLSVIISAVA